MQNINYDGTFGPLVGVVNINTNTPQKFELNQNYPNPFNPVTKIKYSILNRSNVNISVYDILGHKVSEVVSAEQNAGTYEAGFDATKISSGVYFYRINAVSVEGDNLLYTETKKMMLIK